MSCITFVITYIRYFITDIKTSSSTHNYDYDFSQLRTTCFHWQSGSMALEAATNKIHYWWLVRLSNKRSKGRSESYIAQLTRWPDQRALQSRKWQLIGKSQWCCSANCGHPIARVNALTYNWTRVLNHSLSWSKFVNTHLYHSRQWFNIHINFVRRVFVANVKRRRTPPQIAESAGPNSHVCFVHTLLLLSI